MQYKGNTVPFSSSSTAISSSSSSSLDPQIQLNQPPDSFSFFFLFALSGASKWNYKNQSNFKRIASLYIPIKIFHIMKQLSDFCTCLILLLRHFAERSHLIM